MIRYDATDRISARESMRHPYFKEARESDAKRSMQASAEGTSGPSSTSIPTEGVNGSQAQLLNQDQKKKNVENIRTNASDLTNSTSNIINVNSNNGGGGVNNNANNNKPLVKTLPSIGQNGNTNLVNDNYAAIPTQDNSPININNSKIITGNNNISSSKHNTTIPLFNTGNHLTGVNVGGGTSSLPPIASGNGNGGDQSSRSNRSLQQQSAQKKKKKTPTNKTSGNQQQQQQPQQQQQVGKDFFLHFLSFFFNLYFRRLIKILKRQVNKF